MIAPYNLLDLFSGIGGFSLGLERSGFARTVAFCEIDPFCRRVLKKHWPEVPQYEDIRSLTRAKLKSDGIFVNAICGGWPCQDISLAGPGGGLAGERSGLFYEYARIIGEVRPDFAIMENVSELLDRGMGDVLGAISSLGYDAEWKVVSGSEVGLPQERERVWILAYPMQIGGSGFLGGLDFSEVGQGWQGRPKDLQSVVDLALVGSDCFPQPLLRRMDDRPANWVDRVEACGNAVTPFIPEIIGRAILAAEARQ